MGGLLKELRQVVSGRGARFLHTAGLCGRFSQGHAEVSHYRLVSSQSNLTRRFPGVFASPPVVYKVVQGDGGGEVALSPTVYAAASVAFQRTRVPAFWGSGEAECVHS